MKDSNAEKAIAILRENSFLQEADHLENFFEILKSSDESTSKIASNEILGLCQVRSYGNLNIRTINGWKWNTLLEKIASRVRKN